MLWNGVLYFQQVSSRFFFSFFSHPKLWSCVILNWALSPSQKQKTQGHKPYLKICTPWPNTGESYRTTHHTARVRYGMCVYVWRYLIDTFADKEACIKKDMRGRAGSRRFRPLRSRIRLRGWQSRRAWSVI